MDKAMNLDELTTGSQKTELVYLREMNRAQLDTNIVRMAQEKRTQAYLILDKTIFHPKGGGQPSDRGVIRSPKFTLTLKKAIYHKARVIHWGKITSGTISEEPVVCELDWHYRYLLMRRHTAAHLLDHCLANATTKQVQTTDSWLDEPCYVGYRGTAPDVQTLKKAEDLANTMISNGAEVKISFLTPEQSRSLLQTAPNFERLPDLDEVRTVTIQGCSAIPCGGTHVSNIAEIKQLRITQAEQLPDETYRIHFSA
jgi:alanyl-tRNA synthetase